MRYLVFINVDDARMYLVFSSSPRSSRVLLLQESRKKQFKSVSWGKFPSEFKHGSVMCTLTDKVINVKLYKASINFI